MPNAASRLAVCTSGWQADGNPLVRAASYCVQSTATRDTWAGSGASFANGGPSLQTSLQLSRFQDTEVADAVQGIIVQNKARRRTAVNATGEAVLSLTGADLVCNPPALTSNRAQRDPEFSLSLHNGPHAVP